ncbi:MAG: hypothetical protein MUC50_01725 [Myxococcota bacterium]|jgi:hypothetical protein|nr:hypothetical protein [Myxococcota bacterium]
MLRSCLFFSLALIAMAAVPGCGGSGSNRVLTESFSSAPVNFELELDGERHVLSQWRGRPLFLVLLLTSDVTSQLYMPYVEEAFRLYGGKLRFLALTVESQERPFVSVYVESEGLHFPLGVASLEVREGKTALGVLPLVPATYILDERGVVKDVGLGVIATEDIGKALRRALGSEYGK